MEEVQFDELNGLRKLYRKKKTEKLEKQRALRECKSRLDEKVKMLKLDLKFKKADMLKNKALRAEHEITSDTVWKKEIEKITQPDADKITQIEKDAESQIKALEQATEDLNLEISDIHWELTIKLEYYKESPIITNTENLVISSSGK